MADVAVDVDAVHIIVRQAVQCIDVDKEGQTLFIKPDAEEQQRPITLTDRDVQYFVTFLQNNPRAVIKLDFTLFSLTLQAVEILRSYFASPAMSLNHIRFDQMELGNVNGSRLLSGLHDNKSVIELVLWDVNLESIAGGTVISELLQHVSGLEKLWCRDLRLGVEGALALQPGLRSNQTTEDFALDCCNLGDEGISHVVDALEGNTTMTAIVLGDNIITSNGLPHVTRLLQCPSLRAIVLDHSPGLFDNQENFARFLLHLQNSQVTSLAMSYCELTDHVKAAILQAFSTKTAPTHLSLYDLLRSDLRRLTEMIPQMQNLCELSLNLDFTDASVLSAFGRNGTIQHLKTHSADEWQDVATGPVFESLKRNRLLGQASMLLESEPRHVAPLGLWSKAIECLTRDGNVGATAAYTIMCAKLVTWCAPRQTSPAPTAPGSPHSRLPPVVALVAAARPSSKDSVAGISNDDDSMENCMEKALSTTHSTTPKKCTDKRSHEHATAGDDGNDDKINNGMGDDDDATPREKRARSNNDSGNARP